VSLIVVFLEQGQDDIGVGINPKMRKTVGPTSRWAWVSEKQEGDWEVDR